MLVTRWILEELKSLLIRFYIKSCIDLQFFFFILSLQNWMRCQKFDFQITWWIEWISTYQTVWATGGTYDDRNIVYSNDYKKWNESESKEAARLLMKDIMKGNINKQEEDTWCVWIKPKRISCVCKNILRAVTLLFSVDE